MCHTFYSIQSEIIAKKYHMYHILGTIFTPIEPSKATHMERLGTKCSYDDTSLKKEILNHQSIAIDNTINMVIMVMFLK